jgi:GMP synthase-like glutamine amidotransferase
MSKAFGGAVTRNAVKEIGWGEVRVADNAVARAWLGELQAFDSFHWHGETFSIPPGATRLMQSAHCANQAFAIGVHLAMQCHVEMTEELIKAWLAGSEQEMRESEKSPGVQKPPQIEKDLERRVEALHEVANRLYERWTANLRK